MNNLSDFVIYGDTDSLFINIGDFIISQIGEEKWENMDEGVKIKYISEINTVISDYVNENVFNHVQLNEYNSSVEDFKIEFKQEIIAKSGLFVLKKKYVLHIINKEGIVVDDTLIKGLEIIRSDTPSIVKPMLKELVKLILEHDDDDSIILDKIEYYKNELRKARPEEIASNIGVKNMEKYIVNNEIQKGTPGQLRAAHYYNTVLNDLNLTEKYGKIEDGGKIKIVYLKNNMYNINKIAFTTWPVEFNDIFQIDYNTMIDKYFIKKTEIILKPINKEHLLNGNINTFNLMFG